MSLNISELPEYPQKRSCSPEIITISSKRLKTGLKLKGRTDSRTVVVNGNRYYLEPGFEVFWKYVHERQAMHDRKKAGQMCPLTTDAKLSKYRWCCALRKDDRVCQYIINEVIPNGSQEPAELVFRVLLFDVFTKIETWQGLVGKIGIPEWSTYNRKRYENALASVREGATLYTGSFQKPSPRLGFANNFTNHLVMVEQFMEQNLVTVLSESATLEDVFVFITGFNGLGDFNGFQLLLNLTYIPDLIKAPLDDFVVAGRGAVAGLKRCFSPPPHKSDQVALMRLMHTEQAAHFARLELYFAPILCGDSSDLKTRPYRLGLVDIEHSLCELEKYMRPTGPRRRYSHPGCPMHEAKSTSISARSRRNRNAYESDEDEGSYDESDEDIEAVEQLVERDDRDSSVPPSYLDEIPSLPDLEAMEEDIPPAVISEIVARRPMPRSKGKIMQYLVHYYGYPETARKWLLEDEVKILDAELFSHYWESRGLTPSGERLPPPPADEPEKYLISEVVARKRTKQRGVEFLVHWHGYDELERTWEKERTLLEDAPDALKMYYRSRGMIPPSTRGLSPVNLREDHYWVEKILGHKVTRAGMKLEVQWEGYDDRTWELESKLKKDAPIPVAEYWHGLKQK